MICGIQYLVIIKRVLCFQVFRLVSLWFSLSLRQNVINNMLDTIDEVTIDGGTKFYLLS
jgi:hypothetical protein